MKFSIILLGAALCLFSSTEAGISTGSPFNGVTWNGGEIEQVSWADDGQPPPLEAIGITTVDLMAGGDSTQVKVANIGTTQAFAKQIGYTVPKDIGPPGSFYFIKYTAGTYISFSGTFTIANVNGVIAGFDPNNPNPSNSTIPPATSPTPPATPPATPPPSTSSTPSAPKTDNPKAAASPAAANPAVSSLPTPLSANSNAVANSLPSFASIATTAFALALTYLY